MCFLLSGSLSLVAFLCVGNTLGLYLRKGVSLGMHQCHSFKFIYCVDICVSLQYCINVTICFERFLGLQTRYVIAIILAGTSDSVSGNVLTSVSLHVSQCFANHLSEQNICPSHTSVSCQLCWRRHLLAFSGSVLTNSLPSISRRVSTVVWASTSGRLYCMVLPAHVALSRKKLSASICASVLTSVFTSA